MPLITHPDNLRESFLQAFKGKTGKAEAENFRNSLDFELQSISEQLLNGTYDFSGYRDFLIFEPKPRVISAAPFRTRVALQAMMRVCHYKFDSYQIFDSYASRLGKGTYKALDRAMKFAQTYKWFVKLDVRKFFASIDHKILKSQLYALFKDKILLQNIDNLIDSYENDSDKGLPIGNLSSQYFANHYMAYADHSAKETIKVQALVRYMDDVLMFGNDKDALIKQVRTYECFLNDELGLTLHEPIYNRTEFGIPFLGYVVYPYKLRLNQNSRRRLRRRFYKMCESVFNGDICDEDCIMSAQSMLAFAYKADTILLRRQLFGMLS